VKILDKVKYFAYDGRMKDKQEIIDEIRRFNRFYTNIIGLLEQHYLHSPFSLTEGRVLYEICNTEECSAKKIREKILIDEGYLSRILEGFAKRGLIRKLPSRNDGRLKILLPTEKGKREFASLNTRSNQLVSTMIELLSENEREELLHHMQAIRRFLEKPR
jgi:DNA-binding MarR family transcriptional regulator